MCWLHIYGKMQVLLTSQLVRHFYWSRTHLDKGGISYMLGCQATSSRRRGESNYIVVLHSSGSGPCFPHFFWASATATRPKPDHAKTSPWRQVHPASVHGFPVFFSHCFGYQKCPEFPWAVSFETDRPRNGTSPSLYKVMPWGHRIALWMEPTNMGIE